MRWVASGRVSLPVTECRARLRATRYLGKLLELLFARVYVSGGILGVGPSFLEFRVSKVGLRRGPCHFLIGLLNPRALLVERSGSARRRHRICHIFLRLQHRFIWQKRSHHHTEIPSAGPAKMHGCALCPCQQLTMTLDANSAIPSSKV